MLSSTPAPVLYTLLLLAAASAELGAQVVSRKQVSQFGITWTFDKSHSTGQFANGDYWVVGPVTIIKIDPPSVSGTRVMNGSMINPSPKLGMRQGYDSSMKSNIFDRTLNVALDVSATKPLKVPKHSSLVSTISVSSAAHRPQLKGCSILTVLPSTAKPGDFRPSYSGADKSIKFNVSRLDYSLLARLKPTSRTPSVASVEGYFERPWLDHSGKWSGREYHPEDNMKAYGRDLSTRVGIGALMLHLDYSNSRKAKLMTRFVQLGIDLSGIVDDGGARNWHNNGGHASGRKWPILFAGLVLNDSRMKGVGSRSVWFGEDMQTFYVRETSPGVYNNGHGKYNSSHAGMAEYGIRHTTDQKRDDVNWESSYRLCCTANSWLGFVLAARLMGAQTLWNHSALFDYQDRYIATSRSNKNPVWTISFHKWPLEMWDAYRGQGPQLTLSHTNRLASGYSKTTGVHAKKPHPREIRLSWKKAGKAGVHSYRIFRGASATQLKQIKSGVKDLFHTDPELAGGQVYYYVVSAVDSKGKELLRSAVLKVQT